MSRSPQNSSPTRRDSFLVKVLDLEGELDKLLGVCTSGFVVARIDDSLEDEEKEMALNRKKGLK